MSRNIFLVEKIKKIITQWFYTEPLMFSVSETHVIIENKTGYLEGFENDYNLLSVNSPWYSDNGNAYLSSSV